MTTRSICSPWAWSTRAGALVWNYALERISAARAAVFLDSSQPACGCFC